MAFPIPLFHFAVPSEVWSPHAYGLYKSWTLNSWSHTAESQGNYKVKIPPQLWDNQIQVPLINITKVEDLQ